MEKFLRSYMNGTSSSILLTNISTIGVDTERTDLMMLRIST